MIRSSALLVTAALALLVAGVFASSLELVYVSIGISILAALVLSVGVVLRRGELFGTAWAARQGGPADWPAADVTDGRATGGGRTRAGPGGRETGDVASVRRPAAPAVAETGPGRGRDSRGRGPAKSSPGAARRTGDHSAGRAAGGGRPAKSRSNGREPADAEPAGAGSTDGELGWPGGADRERTGSWADHEEKPAPRHRDQPAAWWDDGDAAPPRPPGFRVPPFGDRPSVPPADQPGRGSSVRRPGDDPARPAWPATAGPRAMGTGPAAKTPPAAPGDGAPEPAGGFRPAEPVVPEAHRGLFEPLVSGKPPPLETEPEPDTAGDAAQAPAGPEPPPADGDEKPGELDLPGAAEAEGSAPSPLDGEVTIVPGISRYHRRECILIRFLSDEDLETMTRGAAQAAGSVPCKACQPDNPVPGD